MTEQDTQFLDPEVFNLERAKLERRRKLAQELLQTQAPGIRQIGGWAVGPTGGEIFNAGIRQTLGNYSMNKADEEEAALAAREAAASKQLLSAIPAEGKERITAQANAMRFPSLREAIKAQMLGDEYEAKRIEAGEQAAANRVEKEADRIDRGEQRAADRQAREDLKRTPTVIVHGGGGRGGGIKAPSGYRYNEDGTALEPIPGGPADKSGAGAKPLTNAQEKAALELGGEFATVNRLVSTFKPEYSGDLKSSLTREFGKVAGGAAPAKVQDMTRWWSDQAMMDELPQRHALFGATLTGNEQKAWRDAAISPNLAPEVIQKRLATRQQIMTDAATRMRGSVEASGRSAKQFQAATGELKPALAVVRTGTRNGVKVEQLSDGTIREVK